MPRIALLGASSSGTHSEHLRRAADAGVAAFCEKPIDLARRPDATAPATSPATPPVRSSTTVCTPAGSSGSSPPTPPPSPTLSLLCSPGTPSHPRSTTA
jgi:hypothetical protein